MAEDWTQQWERRTVNGLYPLHRFLGRSDHSVVFLTECKVPHVARAAIKILPAEPALATTQLAYWSTATALSHPHLIRLIDSGRCQLGGHDFLFVVMEYAEQNLAQILPGRALTVEEVRDLLPATLDVLSYLHALGLVHGALKPANFLVVDDRLKLASDTIRPDGAARASTAAPSGYDPPESRDGRRSAAGDIWGLGITLVEALSQHPPSWSRGNADRVSLPADLAPEFAAVIGGCLSRDPGRRPSIEKLAAQFKKPAPPAAAVPRVPDEPPARPPSAPMAPERRWLLAAIAVAVIALGAALGGMYLLHRHGAASQAPRAALPAPLMPGPAAVDNPPASLPPAAAVLHQEIPTVSRAARESVHGIIKIAVRAVVDPAGNVTAVSLDTRASSKYFARVSLDAARKWKFTRSADPAARVWLLHFEFTRAGATAHAAAPRNGTGGVSIDPASSRRMTPAAHQRPTSGKRVLVTATSRPLSCAGCLR